MGEKLLAPIHIAPSRNMKEVLKSLKDGKKLVLEDRNLPEQLAQKLIKVIDDSHDFISQCRVLKPDEQIVKRDANIQEAVEKVQIQPEEDHSDKHGDAKKQEGESESKKIKLDPLCTPIDRMTKPTNEKPVSIHLLDRLDEEPIDL